MTIFYPDIASFQAGISLKGALAVCCKVTESTTYANPDYSRAKANAGTNGTFFMAYHFLHRGSPVAQANWAYSHARSTPLMLDVEPTTGSNPVMADANTFIDAYRKLGGVVHLVYLPHWYWQQMGSPSLQSFKDRGCRLVSSNYVKYSDNGPGWAAYGGMTPTVWQYTDSLSFNGFKRVDFNAFKGTLAELESIARTGSPPAPKLDHAVNPVAGLKVAARYTVADVSWNAAPGAKSYRVIVRRGLLPLRKFETTAHTAKINHLRTNTKHTVTVLALPAKLTDVIRGRARAHFTTR